MLIDLKDVLDKEKSRLLHNVINHPCSSFDRISNLNDFNNIKESEKKIELLENYENIRNKFNTFTENHIKICQIKSRLNTLYKNYNIIHQPVLDFQNEFNIKIININHAYEVEPVTEMYKKDVNFLIEKVTYYLCNQLVY